jgi:hypothetical protein
MICHRYVMRDFLQRFIDKPDSCRLFELLTVLPAPTPSGPFIAGGAIRRTLSNQMLDSDVDYFFRDAEQRAAFDAAVTKSGKRVHENAHVTTYNVAHAKQQVTVQGISIAYYPTIEAVLDSFDFTITQFGYDGTDLVCGEFALWDLARKRLALHKLTHGVSTVRRLIKYTRQGFTACGGCLASILEQTVADPAVIQRTVQYID